MKNVCLILIDSDMDSFRFLILACDGLWKSFDNEEAISYVNELLSKSVKIYGSIASYLDLLWGTYVPGAFANKEESRICVARLLK
ncbi:hypothetical protein COOONC_04901 [Cooperia oncophora]